MRRTNQLVKHKLGFFQVKNKPTQKELENFYSKQYYQNERGSYRSQYSNEEIKYFNAKDEQRFEIISKLIPKGKRLLDIGCGEGYMIDFFKKGGWDVLGLDYSGFGCSKMNPACLSMVKIGDIYRSIDELISKKGKFDVISLKNVLEHVLEPEILLKKIKKLARSNTILIVTVPNDFSFYQNFLLKEKMIDNPFWVIIPDHISYFEKNSLKKICSYAGWQEKEVVADFPIDIFLSNPHSNYIKDKSKGPAAHQARIKLENLFNNVSIKATINLYKAMAELGFGRQITGYYKIK
ncbi:MAG: class I SAM-dependent methyltransferase [Patescibacteria group bacterium]